MRMFSFDQEERGMDSGMIGTGLQAENRRTITT